MNTDEHGGTLDVLANFYFCRILGKDTGDGARAEWSLQQDAGQAALELFQHRGAAKEGDGAHAMGFAFGLRVAALLLAHPFNAEERLRAMIAVEVDFLRAMLAEKRGSLA